MTDNWRDIKTAPTLERLIVAGVQPARDRVRAYWWLGEDTTDEYGVPMQYPRALRWQPMPAPPQDDPENLPTFKTRNAT